MQFLFTYIDEIVGKGASIFFIIEIIFYLSISLIPTALPISVLLASIMVMGNMAERYELASIKSAGVPLIRVMLPLIILGFGVSVFSYFCANNLIPLSNLKFKSRLYDVRKQKPTLSLEKGVFNDDFKGFSIYIGEKGTDNKSIEDVIIYDHHNSNSLKNLITAKDGEMYNTEDKAYFVMNLKNGTQYQESASSGTGKDRSYPFSRTNFKEWTKVFDLGQFEIQETDVNLFKSNSTMLSSNQLRTAIDSLDITIKDKFKALARTATKHFYYLKDTTNNRPKSLPGGTENMSKIKSKEGSTQLQKMDSLSLVAKKNEALRRKNRNAKASRSRLIEQSLTKEITSYATIAETFPKKKLKNIYNRAKASARSIRSQAESTERSLKRVRESRSKYLYQLHIKFSMALSCLIFVFIGAPLGAIMRKGGFGIPIIVSIAFFVFFIVLNVLFKKIAEADVFNSGLAAWMPCLIIFPIGAVLTYRAMKDLQIHNFDSLFSKFKWLSALLNK